MNLRLKRTPGIYLVGFMGSGKSTVGRLLADRIGWPFFDLDEEIEARERTPIADIFATRGEAEFRRIEAAALARHVRAVETGRPAVMALGGGAFVSPSNRDLLFQNGVTIWLDCPFSIVEQRVRQATHRPLARNPEQFAALYQARRDVYRLAEIHVSVEGDDPSLAVEQILGHPLMK
ncbi:MAG: shikimate kinase [Bryobacteraceae bacterium]|jgi:shikimate kinase